ncbi:MAG: ATP-binding cassette domain-containing protein [Candidatus Aminicenantes bacterium]|nr:ATP-binding cassette domain-containing protein [Candidatus Aminicenantes bacterium]MBM3310167.1 ATP-binding cassette domain-containing protein [Candidatus Aminicenantes bacterium]
MIQVDSLTKRYGRQVLFDRIGFKINRRERVGLVGRNGHGKTTLFRLIAGLEEPDGGTIAVPRNYRIGYVGQELDFREPTVLDEAARALPPDAAGERWRVEKMLFGLGFGREDWARRPEELSGGFQVRLNLTKVLLAEYDMLLLDEPNNYLDIVSIRWLERFLVAWPGELILVTHDRAFMDRVVTHTLAIHRRKVRKIEGDTAKLYAQIALEEETYEKTRTNDERKRKEIETFIAKFRASAQLQGLVESRKKTLAKMGRKEKLETIASLDFDFTLKPFAGKYVMTADGLTFGYEPGRPLVRNFGISIGSKDRVFIIGPNGMGKTTLLKLLAGVLNPEAGTVTKPLAVAAGYFEQTNVQTFVPTNTVLEEIAAARPGADPSRARAIAGMMMFEGDNALKRIQVLSGGEKSRVLLGKIIAAPANLLLLDEPTNHLDMDSSDALLAAIDNFDGAVVMVTHNEMFLHALAERLIVFQGDGMSVFEGTYGRFLEKVGWSAEGGADDPAATNATAEAAPETGAPVGRKEIRKLRAEIIAEKSRALRPLEGRIADLEKAMERGEAQLGRSNKDIVEAAAAKDSVRIVALSKAVHELRREIDARLDELEPLLREYDERKAEFDRRLAALEDGSEGQEG